MDIYTNQQSVQVYNGYFMDGTDIGKGGTPYYASAGIAIETQGYPDAPNQPSFSSILIDKVEKYRHITEYCFLSVEIYPYFVSLSEQIYPYFVPFERIIYPYFVPLLNIIVIFVIV